MMGVMYAVAWTVALLVLFGPVGVLIGWPATIAASAIIGGIMSATNATPGDMGVAMACLLLLVAFVVMGLSIAL